jgi:ATP-dependent exoDNAse (exonuclease V) beta subunit
VKQSIYRWRNSDWNILNSIQDSEFKDEIDITSINKLDTNFRSMEEIVRFNNDFFAKAAEQVAGKYDESCGIKTHDIDKAYQSVKQKIYNKNLGKGYVSVCDIQIPTGSEYNYTDLSLKHINSKINEIISKGISPNEIAILVREKKQIEKICLFFSQSDSDIKVISEEAYKLSASSAVNLIIEALTCIANPQSIISRLTLAYLYKTEVLGDETFRYDIDNLICEAALNYNDETDSKEQVFKTLLPESFYKQFENFSITPLSELCEILYDIFELKKIEKQDAYLFSFYDCLTSYLADNPDDINEFLNKWNEEYKDTTIPGNSLDGIRIMTIHKSKGLEFHTVIVPFCHWSMDGKSDTILWCQPNEAPYDKLPLTPINYIKYVQKSIFKKDYDEETLKCYVDNLNLIYVAFTRAESNLFIFTGNHGNGYTANKVIMSSLPERMTKEAIDDITTFYTIGSLLTATESNMNKEDNDENEEVNIMTKLPTKLELQFEHYSSHPQFRQSNESKHFISSDSIPNNYIDEGNIIHHVLEYVYTLNDIPNAVKRVEIEGGFKNEEQRKRIVSIINNGFENKQVQEWFDKKWTVLNERAILSWNSDECISPIRPDRVITDGEQTIVIDYKTGVQNNRYNEQVQNYIDHLYRAGKRNIKGYIWYIATGEVIPV